MPHCPPPRSLRLPANDNRAGVTEITALPYSATQDTQGATGEASDPRGCYSPQPDRTVWYRYTAAQDGRLVASTAGGDGAHRILGQGGNDVLQGGGRDKLVGGRCYDRCTGGAGRDTFRGCEVRRQ